MKFSPGPVHITWLAILAGCLLPFSLAPANIQIFAFISIAGLYLLLEASRSIIRARPGFAFLFGWLFGLGKYGVGASWVYVSIHVYGNASAWLAAMLVALFVMGMSLFEGLWSWCYLRYLRPDSKQGFTPLIFAGSRLFLEWMLTWIFSGFPWLFVGYSQLDAPLASLIPLAGILGAGFAFTFGCVYLVQCIVDKSAARLRLVFGVLALAPWILALVLGGQSWVKQGKEYSVALVQGNVDQATKWQQDSVLPIIKNYQTLSAPYWDVDLMIWPEAAITVFHHQAGGLIEQLEKDLKGTLVLGIPAIEPGRTGTPAFQNTAIAIGAGEGKYVKRRLVPFGEYVPFESALRGLIRFFNLPMSRSAAGNEFQPYLRTPELNMAMAICYEIAYPELVRREGANADVLLTISNDTWFGDSIGPDQHLQIARARALELGRYLLRATNNGFTAVVNEKGKVEAILPQFEAGVLRSRFYASIGQTPYGHYGDTPLLVLVLFVLGTAVIFRFQSRHRSV